MYRIFRVLLLAACCLLPVAGAGAMPGFSNPDFDSGPRTSPILEQIGFDQKLDQSVPLDAQLKDETGNPISLKDAIGGKPVVLSLVYYQCPMLCNLTLNGLLGALKILSWDAGKEFNVVTISFDPREKPMLAAAKKNVYLKEYARSGSEKGWGFFTADQANIEAITKAVGFRYQYDAKTKQFAHASGLVVLTPEGKVSRYFFGVEYSARELKLAMIEASKGKVGNIIDQVVFYCFQYDPAHGKYGIVVLRVLRIAGVLTALALVAFVLVANRRLHSANSKLPTAN